jgi:hypothetical protein
VVVVLLLVVVVVLLVVVLRYPFSRQKKHHLLKAELCHAH